MNIRAQNENEKAFLDIIQSMTGSYQTWQVWSDVLAIMAITVSNSVDKLEDRRERREQEYLELIRKHDPDKVARLFAALVKALDDNPDQDFLGSMYMRLNLGSHWHGQFFTPYDVCRMSAEITVDVEKLKEQPRYISLCDPAIGGGAMLIAAARVLQRAGINYQTQACFVGQDIDRIAGQMAYLQMSLLGMPGYVVIANTITDPIVGGPLNPIEKPSQEFWYTPFWYTDVWQMRRVWYSMDSMIRRSKTVRENAVVIDTDKAAKRHDSFTFFFNFEEGEQNVRTNQTAESV